MLPVNRSQWPKWPIGIFCTVIFLLHCSSSQNTLVGTSCEELCANVTCPSTVTLEDCDISGKDNHTCPCCVQCLRQLGESCDNQTLLCNTGMICQYDYPVTSIEQLLLMDKTRGVCVKGE